jgi:hypothetical protein
MAENNTAEKKVEGKAVKPGEKPIHATILEQSAVSMDEVVKAIKSVISFSDDHGIPLHAELTLPQKSKDAIIGFAESLAKDPARDSDLVSFAVDISRICNSYSCNEERLATLNSLAMLVSGQKFMELSRETVGIAHRVALNPLNDGIRDSIFLSLASLIDSPDFTGGLLPALHKVSEQTDGAHLVMSIEYILSICLSKRCTPVVEALVSQIAKQTWSADTESSLLSLSLLVDSNKASEALFDGLRNDIQGMPECRIAIHINNARGN